MAIYTTFFVADPDALLKGFPGWKLPLAEAVRRDVWNPFTRSTVTVESREPEWAGGAAEAALPKYVGFAIQGPYADYLEGRLPPLVRECPHWAAKGITDVELRPLLRAAGVSHDLQTPIYGPPSLGAVVRQFPADFAAKLATLGPTDLATQWAAAMSTPEHTHSVSGRRLSNGWTTEQAMALVVPISAVAAQQTDGELMYLLIES